MHFRYILLQVIKFYIIEYWFRLREPKVQFMHEIDKNLRICYLFGWIGAGSVLMTQYHFYWHIRSSFYDQMKTNELMGGHSGGFQFWFQKNKMTSQWCSQLLFVLLYRMLARSMNGLVDLFHVTKNGNSIQFYLILSKVNVYLQCRKMRGLLLLVSIELTRTTNKDPAINY